MKYGRKGQGRVSPVKLVTSPARQCTGNDARRLTEEFISRYGRGSAEPSERPTATAQD
jgi:hypothetical protein